MTYIIGQRWISNTESQLGLGIITSIDGRHISILFPAAGEKRIYASDNAPLSRIIYKEGDEILTLDQRKIKITHVDEQAGLLFYTGLDEAGNEVRVEELILDCFIKLTTPQQRLFSGQFDKLNSFKLRIDTLNHLNRLQQSKVRGLLGSRTNHLAHQVYIASEVAQRYAPRVLLADEVGLGKTIEAGMILHHQLYTGRANRVLIVVPDSLLYQWLVEMLRRFNLYFTILDQNRYEQLEEAELEDEEEESESKPELFHNNPFEMETLVLCSLEFLLANKEAYQHALSANWDLLVVDEAHRLHWSEESQSPEYQCIEGLAAQSKGLLLLTATPEQVGIESHFARLRLLDPSRFYDFAAFKKEEKSYQTINKLVQKLLAYEGQPLSPELKSEIGKFLEPDSYTEPDEIIRQLLDRHGTGRVLFRNTRTAIQGFPERHLHIYPLVSPTIYSESTELSVPASLYPETTLSEKEWIQNDPRVEWLSTTLKALHPEKVLIICAKAQTAIVVEQYLKLKIGIRSTSFHEGLSILERDRAAAYFAEQEEGAQVLICSEIGSEGRNFQFAHHLVLFDLPLNPDLLEQRIGRLDRIGQRHAVEIHVPYLVNTAQEVLFRWYHEGINLFEKSCSVGFSILKAFEKQLTPLLETASQGIDNKSLEKLIKETKKHTEKLNLALNEGRDRLLEINSCNKAIAAELISTIEAEEDSLELENYMAKVFHEYGIDQEYHSESTEILRPSDQMKVSHFPGLKEDGVTVTYSRPKALVREEMEFLSWEHPMVGESMEMILNTEMGNATLATISVKGLLPGTLLLETFYTVNCSAPKTLQLERFLSLKPIRVLVDINGKNLSKVIDYSQFNNLCEQLKRHTGQTIIKQIRNEIELMLSHCNKIAEAQQLSIIEEAKAKMNESLAQEVNRLQALQQLNPSIREEEISFFKEQIIESENYLARGALKLQALRVVISK